MALRSHRCTNSTSLNLPSTSANEPSVESWNISTKVSEFKNIQAILFEIVPEPLLATNEDGRIVEANSETENCFGYKREELLGEKIEKLIPGGSKEIHQQHREAYQVTRASGSMRKGPGIFAQRKDGSTFSVEAILSPVATETGMLIYYVFRDMTERQETLEVARLLKFEEALSDLSCKFVNIPPNRVNQEIVFGLEVLVNALETDRASMAQLVPGTGDFIVTHAFARPGIPYFGERLASGVLPWLAERVMLGEIIKAERPEDLPPEAHNERKYMESVGEKSTLIIPLRVGGEIIGGISTDSFRIHRHWDERTVTRVRNVVDIFANALARKNADEELQHAMEQVQKLKDRFEQENIYLRKEMKLEYSHAKIVGASPAIVAVLRKAEQVSVTNSAVLILGETGTGKELIARSIHEMSARQQRAMITVNCAALPLTLIESELFGHEKGAYTGALSRETGRFELADRSTIFLDEIGELSLELQSKLLRVLEKGEFERLGSSKTVHVDVRVIAATNRNLQTMVKEGRFREDLYYRLNVFPIVVPPLRERTEDIPALVWHILKDLGQRMGRSIESVPTSTMRVLQKYPWPGNVRELRNVLERGLIENSGSVLRVEIPESAGISRTVARQLREMEAEQLLKVLKGTRWRVRGKGGAAEIFGLKPTTLEARMKKLGIHRPL